MNQHHETPTLSKLMAEYGRKRERARKKAEKAARALALREPKYATLLEREREAVLRFGRMALAEPQSREQLKAELDAELRAISDAREALLAGADVSPGELLPAYECEKCGDTGFEGDPVRMPCSCLRQKLMERALSNAHLDERVSFENFDSAIFPDTPLKNREETQRSYMEKLKAVAIRYCDSFPQNPKPNVLLYGATGLGKSYLLGCITRRIIERGYNAMMLTAYALQDIVLRERIQNQNTLAMLPYLSVDLLVIDDLGGEPKIGNVSSEAFFSLINERARTQKPTIIATNLAPNELALRYSERVESRLRDRATASIFFLQGTDVRLRGRQT